jgi:hypothetical protein
MMIVVNVLSDASNIFIVAATRTVDVRMLRYLLFLQLYNLLPLSRRERLVREAIH